MKWVLFCYAVRNIIHHFYALFSLFPLQNALMTFEEEKMAKSLTTLRAMEKRCSSNLSWSPSFTSFQSMKSKLWGSNQLSSVSQSVSVTYFPLIPDQWPLFSNSNRNEEGTVIQRCVWHEVFKRIIKHVHSLQVWKKLSSLLRLQVTELLSIFTIPFFLVCKM